MSDTKQISCKVINQQGKDVSSVQLDASIFGSQVKEPLVHETVVWQLAKRRSGTACALTKAEVSGGGKKPFKQKGTGSARAGSNTSPLWIGGGVIHGPKPRDYTTRLSKRTRRQALCAVLSHKIANNLIVVVDDLNVKSGKTKDMAKVLDKIGLGSQKIAIVLSPQNNSETLVRSVRNIPGIVILDVAGVNVYDLMKYKYLLTTKEGIEDLQNRLKQAGSKQGKKAA